MPDFESVNALADLKWDEHGLITAVVQDAVSNAVLMVAWMNAEALQRTRELGEAVFWSRSRSALWRKGETSGNVIRIDCDADTLLLRVDPAGPACHTGATTCFYRTLDELLSSTTHKENHS
jgi:phosphoribosyl-AMP cyclohydrolase